MSGDGGCKYHVIQFLQVPYKDIAEFVCVPRSWVQPCGADVPFVKVSYPVEKPSLTENRVKNLKRKSHTWKSFLSIVRYKTDTYEKAKSCIQQEIINSKKNKEDHTLLSVTTNEESSICTKKATSGDTIDNDALVVGMIEALGWCVSSNSANTIKLKRKVHPDPDKKKHNKRFRVDEPEESDSQIVGPSSKAGLDWSNKNHLSLTPEDSDEDMCTQETPVEKFNNNSTEMRQSVHQNSSKTTNCLDPKIIAQLATSPIFAKWCMLMQELQEVFENSMFKELINKLLNRDNDCSPPQNNDPVSYASSDTTEGVPTLNKENRNEKRLEEKDTDDDNDKDQPIKKKSCPKRVRKVKLLETYVDSSDSDEDFYLEKREILPPEYDASDSRWTLKHHEPAPGLVELMPHTHVYVTNFKRSSRNYIGLTNTLLSEIFTNKALKICTLNDKRAKATDCDETNVRPQLDEHAMAVLINYVTDRAKKEGWPRINTRSILKCISNKMRLLRVSYTPMNSYLY